ncbi:hypothetical protein MTO96_049189 [Rhipicephalus appendiculatus]
MKCSRLPKDKGASYIGEVILTCRKGEVDRVDREGVDAFDRNPLYREEGTRIGDPLIEVMGINRQTPLQRLFRLVRATSATEGLRGEATRQSRVKETERRTHSHPHPSIAFHPFSLHKRDDLG